MPLPAAVVAFWAFRGVVATLAAASLYKAYKAQKREYDEAYAYAYCERISFEYYPPQEPQYYYEREPIPRHRGRAINRDHYSDYRIEDDYQQHDYQHGDHRRRRLQ